jgi:hypothetical protein
MKDTILVSRVITTEGIAELNVYKSDRMKVHVTYFRRKTWRKITEYKGAKTINIIDDLLVKVKARVKEKNLTLWSY